MKLSIVRDHWQGLIGSAREIGFASAFGLVSSMAAIVVGISGSINATREAITLDSQSRVLTEISTHSMQNFLYSISHSQTADVLASTYRADVNEPQSNLALQKAGAYIKTALLTACESNLAFSDLPDCSASSMDDLVSRLNRGDMDAYEELKGRTARKQANIRETLELPKAALNSIESERVRSIVQ